MAKLKRQRERTDDNSSSALLCMRMMNDIFTKNRQRIALRQATHFSSILSTVNKFLVSNIRSRSSAQSTRRTAKHEANYREVIVRVRSSAKLFPQRLKKQSETDISSPLHHLVQESVRTKYVFIPVDSRMVRASSPSRDKANYVQLYHYGDCIGL